MTDPFKKVRGMADPGGKAIDLLNDPKADITNKEHIRQALMSVYDYDDLPIPGDIINHSELGNVNVLKIIDVDIYGGPAEYEIENNNRETFPISFDELIDAAGYGEITDVPQPLKNSFDFTLVNQELAEARLFRYSRSFGAFTGRQIADMMFLNMLVLQLLSLEDKTAKKAIDYAKITVAYGNFALFRTAASDLYLLAYAILHPDNKNMKYSKHNESLQFLKSLQFDQGLYVRYLRLIAQGRATKQYAYTYFFRLETQLKIRDSRYKRWRRLISTYSTLRFAQRNALTAQILFEIKRIGGGSGRGSELIPALEPFLKKRGYQDAERKANQAAAKANKTSFAKRAAGTVAGAIAGKYAMNKLKKAKPSTQSKIGTGIGALAGYWASGRKRQK